jgi:hypothetical protein
MALPDDSSKYSTFSAIPMAYDLFAYHKRLCGMCFLGIIANMTRNKPVHLAWCLAMFYLIKFRTDIEWEPLWNACPFNNWLPVQ